MGESSSDAQVRLLMTTPLSGRSVTVVGINYQPEPTGIGPYNTFLAEALASAGATVRTLTGVPHYPHWKVDCRYRRGLRWNEERNGISITRVRHAVPRKANLSGRARMESSFAAIAGALLLCDRSDAVIAVTPSLGGVVACVAGKKSRPLGVIVQDLTGAGAEQSGTASGGVAGRIARSEYALLRRAQLVGVITPGFSEPLVANGVDPSRIVVVPNFSRVRPSPLSAEAARSQLGWDFGRPIVVHTGNMGMKQGLDAAVEAARCAPDVQFVLVGDGNQRAALAELANGLDNVMILPPVGEADYPVVLAAADVLLLSERDGVGNMSLPSKMTAYVAAGRPILAAVMATGLTGQELQTTGIAHIISPSNPEKMVEGVRVLMGSPGLRASLVAAQVDAYAAVQPAAAEERYVAFAERLLALK